MPRKNPPETLAYEFWVVEAVEVGRYHGSVRLRDVSCWIPTDDLDDDWPPSVEPGTKGAECAEHTEHEITFPIDPKTRLRPGDKVRITVEHVA